MARVPFVERRVEQAPVGVELSRVRATGQDFGSTVGESVTQAGRQMGDVIAKYQAEKDNKASMEAFNAFTEEAGKAQIGFRSLKANAVNDEVKNKYVEDLDKIRNKYRGQLSGRALEQFNAAADRAVVAKRLDAESHTVNETRAAAEIARSTLVNTGLNEAAAFDGDFSANEALTRALNGIAMDPRLGGDKDAVKAAQAEAAGSVAAAVVSRHLKSGDIDGAAQRVESAKASGLLDQNTVAELDAQIGRATQHRDDTQRAELFLSSARLALAPGERPEDVDLMQVHALEELNTMVSSGQMPLEQAERIRPLIAGQSSQIKQARVIRDRADEAAAVKAIEGAGLLEPALTYIAALPSDKQWMRTGLVALAEQRYGDPVRNRKLDAAQEALAPGPALKAETALINEARLALQDGQDLDPDSWVARAADEGLRGPAIERVRKFVAGKGAPDGLSPNAVLDGILDPKTRKAFKEDPARLHALYLKVAERWDPQAEANDKTVAEQVTTLLWQGSTSEGEDIPYLDAVIAGKEHLWRPTVTAEQLETIKGEMFRAADKLRAEGEALIAAGKTEEGQALISEAFDLKYPAIQAGRGFADYLFPNMGLPVGYLFQDSGLGQAKERALPLNEARQIRAEEFLLSSRFTASTRSDRVPAAVEGLMAGAPAEDQRKLRMAAMEGANRANQEAEVRQMNADLALIDHLSTIKEADVIGVQAANVQLERDLNAGRVPKWLNAYLTATGQKPLMASTPEEVRAARLEAYTILNRVAGR